MLYKSAPVLIKANPSTEGVEGIDPDTGEFEAIVSVFGNVDAAGDVVMPGAFKDSLDSWTKSLLTMPVLWSHRTDDPRFNIGGISDAEEVAGGDPRIPKGAHPWVHKNGGLWVKGRLDIGPGGNEIASATHRLMKAGRVSQFSFAYDIEDAETNSQGWQLLKRLFVHEVSTVQLGCNELTAAGPVKSGEPASSQPNSSKASSLMDSALASQRIEIEALCHLYG